MPVQPFAQAILASAFPDLRGFHLLATGGYKFVYRVTTTSGAGEVLKVVRLPQDQSTEKGRALLEQELGRATRETALLQNCRSPFIVRLGSVLPRLSELAGETCLAYSEELLPGADLREVISQGNKPTFEQVGSLLACMVGAISELWTRHRAVHRDIKPANIFATGLLDRPYVVLDLGIAYTVSEPGLTADPTQIPATPLYMAPEMLDPNFRENLSYRADLYAAGVTAFEFATAGVHPLARTGDNLVKTVSRVLRQEPLRLAALRPDLPPRLTGLIDQLLKKKPALRPGNLSLILKQIA